MSKTGKSGGLERPQYSVELQAAGQFSRRPEYPLYAAVFGGNRKPELSERDREIAARCFDFVYSGPMFATKDMEAVRQLNPGFQFIRYVGTWLIDHRTTETGLRRQILYYGAGVLAEALDERQTEFGIAPVASGAVVSLKASTFDGLLNPTDREHPNDRFFVTWILIDDEMMRIEAFAPSSGRVRVTRGFGESRSAAHTKSARVFCPEYGNPPGQKSSRGITYHHDPAFAARWERILGLLNEFAEAGGDGVWIDILGCRSLREVDIDGESVASRPPEGQSWDFKRRRPYTRQQFRRHSEEGVASIQQRFHEKWGRWPILYGNNMMATVYEDEDGGMRNYLIPTKEKPRSMDGMCIEDFAGGYDAEEWAAWEKHSQVSVPAKADSEGNYRNWRLNAQIVMKAAQSGLAAIPLIINAGMKTAICEALDRKTRHEWERWAYALYLLGVEREEGACPTKLGTVLYYRENGQRYVDLDECYFWPLGDPAETRRPEDIDGYRLAGHGSYARRFANGIVLLNPQEDTAEEIELDREYVDPESRHRIRRVTMAPQSGRILLIREGQE